MASLGTQDIQKGAACFAYGLISTSITLFNKAVFAKFHFNYPNLVTSMQIAISIFYMLVMKSFGLAHIDRLPSRKLHKVGTKLFSLRLRSACTISVLISRIIVDAFCTGHAYDDLLVAVRCLRHNRIALYVGAYVQVT